MGSTVGTLRGAGLALAVMAGLAGPAAANSLSGGYLAARQASFLGDFKAAADYYGRA